MVESPKYQEGGGLDSIWRLSLPSNPPGVGCPWAGKKLKPRGFRGGQKKVANLLTILLIELLLNLRNRLGRGRPRLKSTPRLLSFQKKPPPFLRAWLPWASSKALAASPWSPRIRATSAREGSSWWSRGWKTLGGQGLGQGTGVDEIGLTCGGRVCVWMWGGGVVEWKHVYMTRNDLEPHLMLVESWFAGDL